MRPSAGQGKKKNDNHQKPSHGSGIHHSSRSSVSNRHGKGSVVDMLDKHVRTGILEGVNGWLNRRVLRSGGSS